MIHSYGIFSTELPLQFTKPLSDIEVMEGQEATLECVVSRADLPAKWLCKGKPLPKDNRITTTCDKNTHKLVMQSVTMDDQNEYSVKIGDKVSKAKLFVEGMLLSFKTVDFTWSYEYAIISVEQKK